MSVLASVAAAGKAAAAATSTGAAQTAVANPVVNAAQGEIVKKGLLV